MTEPQARAFVWGTPTALAVADVTGGRPEVIVSTDERLLYRFTWEDGRLMQAMSPLHDARLPFDYMTPIRWSGHLSDYLLAHNLSGVGVWRLSSSSIALIDEGWASPPLAAALWPGTDAILIAERTGERSGTLRAWARRPSNFLDFTVDGVPAALSDPPLSQQDQIMLSAARLGRRAGSAAVLGRVAAAADRRRAADVRDTHRRRAGGDAARGHPRRVPRTRAAGRTNVRAA